MEVVSLIIRSRDMYLFLVSELSYLHPYINFTIIHLTNWIEPKCPQIVTFDVIIIYSQFQNFLMNIHKSTTADRPNFKSEVGHKNSRQQLKNSDSLKF